MALYATALQIDSCCRGKAAPPVNVELPIALHGTQASPQRFEIALIRQCKCRGNATMIEGPALIGEQLENGFARGNGMFIALSLAAGLGISVATATAFAGRAFFFCPLGDSPVK